MTIALVEETLKIALHTHRREGDPTRTPCQQFRVSEQAQRLEHLIGIVERFAHSHHHDIGERSALRDSVELVKNLACRKVGTKSLAPRHAESTMHLAPYLR